MKKNLRNRQKKTRAKADMPEKKKKEKNRKFTFTTFAQSIFITARFYLSNDLLSYSSSCAFGFLFSLIPVVMMIATVAIRILHFDPNQILGIINRMEIFSKTFDFSAIVSSILNMKSVSIFDIVIVAFILWMSRRFFSSLNLSMNRIFRTQIKAQPVFRQMIIILGELVLIILSVIFIIATIFFRTFLNSTTLQGFLPEVSEFILNLIRYITKFLPSILLFVITFLCFKFWSRSNPKTILCILTAALNTITFVAVMKFMSIFSNVNRYNLVYGILSSTMVMLVDVYFFFNIFLFFAQLLYTMQFFDTLLLGEIYLLPKYEDTRLAPTIIRTLFIKPDFLLSNRKNVLRVKAGELIYRQNDTGHEAFYITKGSVQLFHEFSNRYLDRGDFFGEDTCIITEKRTETAIAVTDVTLVRISSETFEKLIEKNPGVAKKALGKVSTDFARLYGRITDYKL